MYLGVLFTIAAIEATRNQLKKKKKRKSKITIT